MIRRPEWIAAAALLAMASAREAPAPKRVQAWARDIAIKRPGFVSPRGGEIWREGQSYVIRWQAPGWDSVNVAAVMGGKDRGHLAFSAKTDTLVWSIPVGWVTGF